MPVPVLPVAVEVVPPPAPPVPVVVVPPPEPVVPPPVPVPVSLPQPASSAEEPAIERTAPRKRNPTFFIRCYLL